MNSSLTGGNVDIRTQEVAKKVSKMLGVESKITYHAGGSSISSTFASSNISPESIIEVIGPDICNKYGPFDLIFIDGLHYEKAVYSDLCLAVEHLSNNGIIALHDLMGRWGGNVRRAVFQFLDKNTQYRLSHNPYKDIYYGIGFIEKKPTNLSAVRVKNKETLINSGIVQHPIVKNFASILIENYAPKSVAMIGNDDFGILSALADYSISNLLCVSEKASTRHDKDDRIIFDVHDFKQPYAVGKKFDLCICLATFEKLNERFENSIIDSCMNVSNTIVFASTPPGELGSFGYNCKPLRYWVKKFLTKGFLFKDEVRPNLEPWTYPQKINKEYQICCRKTIRLLSFRQ